MKVKAHVRIAKNKKTGNVKVTAGTVPRVGNLTDSYGHPLPTVAFAVVLDVPDEALRRAEIVVAEIQVPLDSVEVVGSVPES